MKPHHLALKYLLQNLPPPKRNNFRVCCGAFLNKRLIVLGFNSYTKTHPIMRKWGKNAESIFLHAEIDCLLTARRKLCDNTFNRLEFFVARINRQGELVSAKPCVGCMKAFMYFDVKSVNWS